MITCPDCKGTGWEAHRAFHIHHRVTVLCSEIAWLMLPSNEDGAAARGENWCRFPREICPTCKGDGEIPENY
jgi:DnaJ-class molecular chaperone